MKENMCDGWGLTSNKSSRRLWDFYLPCVPSPSRHFGFCQYFWTHCTGSYNHGFSFGNCLYQKKKAAASAIKTKKDLVLGMGSLLGKSFNFSFWQKLIWSSNKIVTKDYRKSECHHAQKVKDQGLRYDDLCWERSVKEEMVNQYVSGLTQVNYTSRSEWSRRIGYMIRWPCNYSCPQYWQINISTAPGHHDDHA